MAPKSSIRGLIADSHESAILELKSSLTGWKPIVQAISSFSNAKGGTVLVGVKDDGTVIGVSIGKRTLEDLANKIRQNTDPAVFPRIATEDVEGKTVIVIEVEESKAKPVFAFDKVFKRVGKSDHRVTSAEIRKMALEGRKVYWDEQVCEGATIDDIDETKIGWFLKEGRKQRALSIQEDAPLDEALMRLKLLREGKPTNAAVLLFGKTPQNFFIQSEIKCMRFHGDKPIKPYVDFQSLDGNVFDMIDEALKFVLRNIKKAIWLVSGQAQREEKEEYPPDAIREAIVNATVHREYSSPSKVQVRIFDHYIEIWNPGKLPEGWTIDTLKRKHESIPKNPLLFRELFWVKYVEDIGGGTLDMIEQCRDWGISEPEFEDTGTSLVVTFRKSKLTDASLRDLELNDRQRKAIEYLNEKGRITNKDYVRLNKVSRNTATNELKELVNKGLLKRLGTGRGSYFEVA